MVGYCKEILRLRYAALRMAFGWWGKEGGYMWVGAVMPMRVRQRWSATRAAAVSFSRAEVRSQSAGSEEMTRQFS